MFPTKGNQKLLRKRHQRNRKRKLAAITSNVPMTDWFWDTYTKALNWQNQHKVAYWKSCALALQEENRFLYTFIRNATSDIKFDKNAAVKVAVPPKIVNITYTNEKNYNFQKKSKTRKNKREVILDEDHDYEFEASPELIEYFKAKKKREEAAKKETVPTWKIEEDSKKTRIEEMKLLYGEDYAKITGMEKSIELSFDRYCYLNSPEYWPKGANKIIEN